MSDIKYFDDEISALGGYPATLHFLEVIHIDKHAKHHRCPRCKDVILTMTDDHILCCPVSDISEIDEDKLPTNFDPEALPLKYCPPCRKDVALEEAEALLGEL